LYKLCKSILDKIEFGINFVSIYARKYSLTVIKSEK